MTTNILVVFNFVLKGNRSLPVSGIVDYTFHKCNEYFAGRWEKARNTLAKAEHSGNLEENTFLSKARYQIMEFPLYLIQRSLCMRLSHQVRLILVVTYL
jgi:hypothetical protein